MSLYANINAKKKRIAAGSGEKMKRKEQKELQQLKTLRKLKKQLKNQ